MKRRDFITLLGGATAWPLAVRAQQPAMPVIGVRNLTGVSFLTELITAKRLEVLHEIAPKAVRIGLLVNPTVAQTENDIKEGLDTARALGLELRVFNASNEREIDAAFATLAQWQAGGLLIDGGGYLTSRSTQLAGLALSYKLP